SNTENCPANWITYERNPSSSAQCTTTSQSKTKMEAMPIRIRLACRIPAHIRIKIQRLWIAKARIRYRYRCRAPVRRHPPPQFIRVVPCSEVIKPGFDIPLLAGEFVIIRVVIDVLQLAA